MDSSLIRNVGPLSPLVLERIHRCAAFAAVSFAEKFAVPNGGTHLGGCLCVMDTSGRIQLDVIVGKIQKEHRSEFHKQASIMCAGLHARNGDLECLSSWFFRDEKATPPQYGGGIELFNGSYMAFAGFPEAVNEAFCVALSFKHHLLTEALENRILAISGNRTLAQTAKEFIMHTRA